MLDDVAWDGAIQKVLQTNSASPSAEIEKQLSTRSVGAAMLSSIAEEIAPDAISVSSVQKSKSQVTNEQVENLLGQEGDGLSADDFYSEDDEQDLAFGPSSAAEYLFEEDVQEQIAAHVMFDNEFMRRVDGLIEGRYFTNYIVRFWVEISLTYFNDHGRVPTMAIARQMALDSFKNQRIDTAERKAFVDAYNAARKVDLSHQEYLIGLVAQFARNRAVEAELLKAVDHMRRGRFDLIEKGMNAALSVGANDADVGVDFWKETEKRMKRRQDIADGKITPDGITTGLSALDMLLHHKGWGRKELSVIMGAAKKGKSTALAHFAKNASLAGKNVLYLTLEVSSEIIVDRLDANVSDTSFHKLVQERHNIKSTMDSMAAGVGVFKVFEAPPSYFTPKMLRRLIRQCKQREGIDFDLVVIDYLDIMAPDVQTKDPIENSKSIWLGVRRIAVEENIAILTATQTNRAGAQATVAADTDVAEDFNKIRIADLVISINRSDEEEKNGEARLHFAASRNQKAKVTIRVKQDLDKMNFARHVISIE